MSYNIILEKKRGDEKGRIFEMNIFVNDIYEYLNKMVEMYEDGTIDSVVINYEEIKK